MIYEILKERGAKGPERAITRGKLMEITGLNLRALRHTIQKERKYHIICGKTTGEGGYYRPKNRAEIEAYRDLFEKRIAQFAVSLRLPRSMMKHTKRASK